MKNIKIYFFTLVFVPTFILSTILISGCGGSSSDSTSNILVFKAELNNQMQEMQNSLNDADYVQFMQNYVDPGYITDIGGINEAVNLMDISKQTELFVSLQLAKNIEPIYSKTSNVMKYIGGGLTIPVTFVQINSKWFLTRDSFLNTR
ncbi:MAG: hypothetical protein WAT71_12080 [Ignavibacteria bacterium]